MLDEMNDFEGQNKWQINEYTTTNKGIKKWTQKKQQTKHADAEKKTETLIIKACRTQRDKEKENGQK